MIINVNGETDDVDNLLNTALPPLQLLTRWLKDDKERRKKEFKCWECSNAFLWWLGHGAEAEGNRQQGRQGKRTIFFPVKVDIFIRKISFSLSFFSALLSNDQFFGWPNKFTLLRGGSPPPCPTGSVAH